MGPTIPEEESANSAEEEQNLPDDKPVTDAEDALEKKESEEALKRSRKEGWKWTGLTIILAIVLTLFSDILIGLANKSDQVSAMSIFLSSLKPDRVFGVGVVLVSAVIVEYYFSLDRPVEPRFHINQLMLLFVLLGSMIVASSVHHLHDDEVKFYRSHVDRLESILNRREQYTRDLGIQDSVPCKNAVLGSYMLGLDTEKANCWKELKGHMHEGTYVPECHCQWGAVIMLVFALILSGVIRFQMTLEKENRQLALKKRDLANLTNTK